MTQIKWRLTAWIIYYGEVLNWAGRVDKGRPEGLKRSGCCAAIKKRHGGGQVMAVSTLMMQGVQLLLIGMGIVFSFLILLVFAMKGMSWLAFRLGGHPEDAPAPAPSHSTGTSDDSTLIAVISAAVERYRQARR
jgi:oxaloacetate decarboxylase gamma subunit